MPLRAEKRVAGAFNSSAEIVDFLAGELHEGDVLLVLSNGSFDGLCDTLLARLSEKTSVLRGTR